MTRPPTRLSPGFYVLQISRAPSGTRAKVASVCFAALPGADAGAQDRRERARLECGHWKKFLAREEPHKTFQVMEISCDGDSEDTSADASLPGHRRGQERQRY